MGYFFNAATTAFSTNGVRVRCLPFFASSGPYCLRRLVTLVISTSSNCVTCGIALHDSYMRWPMVRRIEVIGFFSTGPPPEKSIAWRAWLCARPPAREVDPRRRVLSRRRGSRGGDAVGGPLLQRRDVAPQVGDRDAPAALAALDAGEIDAELARDFPYRRCGRRRCAGRRLIAILAGGLRRGARRLGSHGGPRALRLR